MFFRFLCQALWGKEPAEKKKDWTFFKARAILAEKKPVYGVIRLSDFNAFDMIRDGLAEELSLQGFQAPEPLETEEGRAEMFSTGEVAYSLLYDKKNQRFQLRSTTLTAEGKPGDWRSLSLWLFDEQEGNRADAESILNDFLDVVRGPKRVAVVQQKRKKGKDDERTINPMFFCNRLVGVFPELRDELNEEKIVYGQVRFVAFSKAKVVPKVEDLAEKYPNSEPCEKLCALFDDMYKNGDLDLRSILTAVILNGVNDKAFETLSEKFGDELKKAAKFSRKLKGKKIKPEKKKKEKKVVARLSN